MYECTECGKKYSKQNSLTRHLHNHRKAKQHICHLCKVVFYRRDLLSRHLRLHEDNASSALESNFQGRASRRRCHTACDRCREHRTKCDGRHPCSTCIKANKNNQCEFNSESNRLSHVPITEGTPSLPSTTQEGCTGNDKDSVRSGSENELQDDFRDELLYSRVHPAPEIIPSSESHQLHYQTQKNSLPNYLESQAEIEQDDIGQNMPTLESSASHEVASDFNPHIFNMVSWPWLHENLYLPEIQNYNLDPIYPTNMADLETNEISNTLRPIPNPMHHLPFQDIPENVSHLQSTQPASTLLMGSGSSVQEHLSAQLHNNVDPTQPDEFQIRQDRVINDLVAFALIQINSYEENPDRSSFWQSVSTEVATAFQLGSNNGSSGTSTLNHFINLYFRHFGPLWPLLSFQNLELDQLHPFLYLVLTSIGAMYGGPKACVYGAMIHNSVRSRLTSAFELDDFESDFTWLAQARLLTQVAALYFGQPKAFSYAQHLGALLVAQARRMDLFSSKHAKTSMANFHDSKGILSDNDRLSIWLHLEARRRLAFGIFRGDTYTSVLLHVKPLVCMEEIDLELPCCDAVWRAEKMPPQICLHMIESDRTPSRDMRASDIYRINLDPEESLPPLDPAGHELLLFGLQWPLWRFSRDQKVFERLAGQERDYLAQQPDVAANPDSTTHSTTVGPSELRDKFPGSVPANTTASEADRLCRSSRKMSELASECNRFMAALRKWEQALPLVKNFVYTDGDRSSLLSSLILYHLGYLRLFAPIEDLHQIQYRLAENRKVDDDLIRSVKHWANSSLARLAAERACNIWSLITTESRKVQKNNRIRFNLLAFTGLHHGAVLLWSYAGARDLANDMQTGTPALYLESLDYQPLAMTVTRSESPRILTSFVKLYDLVSPARWSSFAQAAKRLSEQSFPASPGQLDQE